METFNRIALVFGSSIFCLLIIELFFRLISFRTYPKGYYTFDRNTGLIAANPNYKGYHRTENGRILVKTNDFGFRGPLLKPTSDKQRLLILGDSFTQAVQVNIEDTFGSILSASKTLDIDVMQVGMPGWGQGDEIRWLKAYYKNFQPQIVVFAVYLGNDLTIDNMGESGLGSNYYSVTANGYLSEKDPSKKLFALFKEYTIRKSYAYLYLRSSIAKAYILLTSLSQGEGLYITKYEKLFLPLYEKDLNKNLVFFDTFYKYLIMIKKMGVTEGFKPIILLIPWQHTLRNENFESAITFFDLNPDDYNRTLPMEKITEFLKKENLDYVNLFDFFNTKSNPLDAYNGHFNKRGHQWTAKAIEEKLLRILP